MICEYLNDWTEEQVIQHVARHLLEQNAISGKIHGSEVQSCFYRFGELKCAAGCLIPDEEYSSDLEGKVWPILVNTGRVPRIHAAIICRLQSIHDSYRYELNNANPVSPREYWLPRLKETCEHLEIDHDFLKEYEVIDDL